MSTISNKIQGNCTGLESLKRRFLRSALELHQWGKSIGINIVPTRDVHLPLFSALPNEKQVQVVDILETSCQIYANEMQEKKSIRNGASVIWMAFKSLNLIPPSDFFDKHESDDIIQIYNKEGFHRFANIRFFELCSYTVEQVYSLPWPELWHRDPANFEHLLKNVGEALAPDFKGSLIPTVPPHLIRELKSPFLYEFEYCAKCIAPLYDKTTKQKDGFIVIENGILLNKIESAVEEEIRLKDYYETQKASELDLS